MHMALSTKEHRTLVAAAVSMSASSGHHCIVLAGNKSMSSRTQAKTILQPTRCMMEQAAIGSLSQAKLLYNPYDLAPSVTHERKHEHPIYNQ